MRFVFAVWGIIAFLFAQDPQHFILDIEGTGNYQLIIFTDSLNSLEPGDEVGVFDQNGITETNDCSGDFSGEVLVAAGVWMNDQLNLSAIGSVDQCSWGGPQLNGFVNGNEITVRIWQVDNNLEFDTQLTIFSGSGIFGEPLTVVSDFMFTTPVWVDDPSAYEFTSSMVPLIFIDALQTGSEGDLLGAFAADGEIRGVGGALPLPDFSPYSPGFSFDITLRANTNGDTISFKFWDYSAQQVFDISQNYIFTANEVNGNVMDPVILENTVFGCTEITACNYNEAATNDDGSCDGLLDDCGVCDGNNEAMDCNGDCLGTAVFDECNVCGGDGIPPGYCDCLGNVQDECGVCGGTGQTDYYYDADADGWGAGAAAGFCPDDVPTVGWVDNNLDVDDNIFCESNFIDECSLCDGDGYAVNCTDMSWVFTNGDCNAMDCEGNCGGSAMGDECSYCTEGSTGLPFNFDMDACSDCGGTIDDPTECDPPEFFSYNQSTLQAFYFIGAVTINGSAIESEDWVGIFNGSLCAGARLWNTEECGGNLCDVPAQGYDGNEWTTGYFNVGDNPTFQIYDASEDIFYSADASPNYSWENFGMFILDSLKAVLSDCNGDNYYDMNDNPAIIDDCGNCVEGSTGAAENWELDACGICGGENNEIEAGIVIGPDAGCDGLCYSGLEIGCAGICGGPMSFTWYADEDGDGLGNPDIVVEGCSNPEGFTSNGFDIDDSCACPANDESCYDCMGDCGDSAYLDNCGTCDADANNDNLPNTGDCDCLGISGGSAVVDDCGICNGNNLELDCAGNCNEIIVDNLWRTRIAPFEYCIRFNIYDDAKEAILNSDLAAGDWITISGLSPGDEYEGRYQVAELQEISNFIRLSVDSGEYDVSCGLNQGSYTNSSYITIKREESYYDDCGNCVGGNGLDENYAMDACGICGGGNTADANGFVSGPDAGCDGICDSGVIFDDCAVCDGSNGDLDGCGVCFGNNADDLGCGCFEEAPETWFVDNDGDGLGAGDGQEFCSDPGAGWADNNDDTDDNCAGTVDDCGICNGGNADIDCSGECFGNAELDNCAVCNGENAAMDCNGECFGNTELDVCGACGGPGAVFDCGCWEFPAGDCDCEGNTQDECGVCAGGGVGEDGCCSEGTPEYIGPADCAGDCGGTALIDDCEDCGGAVFFSTEAGEICDCGGAVIDDCGTCDGPGMEVWYEDSDGDGLGSDDGGLFCPNEIPADWVNNDDDVNDEVFCPSNEIDDCEVCEGGNADNLGCGCFIPAPESYWLDEDGDGLGYGDPVDFCEPQDGWVDNDDDLYPYCAVNYYDCLNQCGGVAEPDYCGICQGENSCFAPELTAPEDSSVIILTEEMIGNESLEFSWQDTSAVNLDSLNYQLIILSDHFPVVLDTLLLNEFFLAIPYLQFELINAGIISFNWYVTAIIEGDSALSQTWQFALDVPGMDVYSNLIPNEFALYQNYPNPFNPVTKISYAVPLVANISLRVLDISGREVELLVNGEKYPGTYEINWNAANHASGMYILEMQVQSAGKSLWQTSRKLLLLK